MIPDPNDTDTDVDIWSNEVLDLLTASFKIDLNDNAHAEQVQYSMLSALQDFYQTLINIKHPH
jgi:hypothetical protein